MDWNLKDLYKSPDSKKIGSDFTKLDSKSKKFNKKYRNRISNSSSPKLIFESLVEIEKIYEGLGKISSYASLLFAADTDNEKYSKFYQNVSERSSDIRKNLIFYFLSWNKISEKRAKEIYSNPILRKYSHLLKSERKYKNFMLTEPEEKILDKKSITSSKAFNRLFDQTLNNLKFEMKLKNKISVLTETEVLSLLYDKDRKIRKSAAKSLTIGLKSERKLLAFIFNQILTDSKITNEIRGHKTPMSARNLSNEISEKTVQALIDTCNKYNKVPIRYYKLKSKILKIKDFADYDRYAPLGQSNRKFSFSDAKKIVLDSFNEFSPQMGKVAELFFDNNWIDYKLRKGKRGGAFSHSCVPSVHPYILMNFTGKIRDVMTLAHELGHGIHQYLSRKNGYFQQNTPLTTAETASVFAEMLVFTKLLNNETNKKEKLYLICSKLEDIFATVFRQIVMTNFELDVHTKCKKTGELSSDDFDKAWTKANSRMFGNSIEISENYKSWWMYIPHFIHSPFYCYSYSFGELLVHGLFAKYKEDNKGFVKKYIELLSSGSTNSPESLVKKTGLDITKSDFWESSMYLMNGLLKEAENIFYKK
ncbi:M3 family oligoendopeptidase [bacterium]|jgi:oligoendopeptidase F|nr:M3 family oligoendopeptidase [bacterium]MBT3795187.1 M3 family oligoendopeptidase [bacterium]